MKNKFLTFINKIPTFFRYFLILPSFFLTQIIIQLPYIFLMFFLGNNISFIADCFYTMAMNYWSTRISIWVAVQFSPKHKCLCIYFLNAIILIVYIGNDIADYFFYNLSNPILGIIKILSQLFGAIGISYQLIQKAKEEKKIS